MIGQFEKAKVLQHVDLKKLTCIPKAYIFTNISIVNRTTNKKFAEFWNASSHSGWLETKRNEY